MEQSENLKLEFEARLLGKAQELTELRKATNLSQSDMAFKCGVSRKTVERFETFKSINPYLCFAYQRVLVGSRQSTNNSVKNLLKYEKPA